MKLTFFGQFVAGTNEEEITKVVKRMKAAGITSALCYSVEADLADQDTNIMHKNDVNSGVKRNYYHKAEAVCDVNTDYVLKSVVTAAGKVSQII